MSIRVWNRHAGKHHLEQSHPSLCFEPFEASWSTLYFGSMVIFLSQFREHVVRLQRPRGSLS